MVFPITGSSARTLGTTASTNAQVNLPGGIQSDDLLLIIHRTAVAGAHTYSGSGWTELKDNSPDPSDDNMSLAWKKADGTEGAFWNITQGNGKFATIAIRITGAADPTIQPPEVSTDATGTSTAPNPLALTGSGGSKNYLWLWMGGWEGEQTSPPAGSPTNYSGSLGADSGTGGVVATNVRVAYAQRLLTAASEDPPSWTISASDDWTAWTVVIHPAPITKTHTADIFLQSSVATQTKTHTADILLLQTQSKTYTADLLSRATQTKTHTTDLLLLKTQTKTNTTDLLLKATQTKTHSVDSLLKAIQTKIHTTDIDLQGTATKTHTTDLLLLVTQTKNHTTNLFLVNRPSKTYTVDISLLGTLTKTYTADIQIGTITTEIPSDTRDGSTVWFIEHSNSWPRSFVISGSNFRVSSLLNVGFEGTHRAPARMTYSGGLIHTNNEGIIIAEDIPIPLELPEGEYYLMIDNKRFSNFTVKVLNPREHLELGLRGYDPNKYGTAT